MSASIGQEVSDMLAAALEQMDGIIANTRFDSQNGPISITSPSRPQRYTQYSRVIKLLEDLKLALELCEDRKRVVRQMPTDVLKYVLTWLSYTDEACKVFKAIYQHKIDDQYKRWRENPVKHRKEPSTNKKLMANFLTFPHRPSPETQTPQRQR